MTLLRLVRQSPLPQSTDVRVIGVDEWAWRKGQRYGTILVDLEKHIPIDLLADATAESFANWLQAHPTVEIMSRDRGTTFAEGASRGAPHAQQIADRWHLLHNLGEALEKVLARHHADLKRTCTPEEEHLVIAALDQKALARAMTLSQAEQFRQARREQRFVTFTRVQELSAQGWSGASIARMLGIHKKTAVKYAQMEHFPEERSDRGRKLAPYLLFLHTQWSAGEQNIASLYQAIHTQGYTGSETAVRHYLTALAPRKSARKSTHGDTILLSPRRRNSTNVQFFQAVVPPGGSYKSQKCVQQKISSCFSFYSNPILR